MKKEDKPSKFYELYTQFAFEELRLEEQVFVIDHFSKEEYQYQRDLHIMLEKNSD